MIILVSDTSVLIDLERGGLLESAFNCGLTMVVPDLLYERELENENGPYLRTLGLGVLTLTPTEVRLVQEIRAQRSALSLPDCFALSCATRESHCLITGDRALRTEAQKHHIQVYGLLWLLDQMAIAGVTNETLHAGLFNISTHPRCRLPADEVRARLDAWAKP
jgi:predicted nucleic acid-binding protein